MSRVTTSPRAHIVLWALVIALCGFAVLPGTVEAGSIPGEEPAPAVDSIGVGGGLPAFCYAWRTKRETTHYFSGFTGFPHIYVDWQVRYNGCDVVRDFVTCSVASTAISAAITWCGFYQSSAWDKDLIHVGANWNECTSPIKNLGVCYSNHVRQHARRDGYMRYRLYHQNEPSGGWTANSPY